MMAERVDPPYDTWSEVLTRTPGLVQGLSQLYENQHSGTPKNVADLGMELLTAASSFGRTLYQVSWPPTHVERESLEIAGEYLVVTGAESLAAIFRFREASLEIRPTPDSWARLLGPLAQSPDYHFYWLGRRWPLHAFAYALWGYFKDAGHQIGELLALGSDLAGEAPLTTTADLTALSLTLPASLRLGLDAQYPGRGGPDEPYSAR
jgi:hypothetical protein